MAATIFTQGCPFRCHFCHNASLVLPKKYDKLILENEILDFLQSRQGKLDAVVISGGEPTIQPDLPIFLKKIKELGFLIKLDTSGINPHKLLLLFKAGLLDYIAMDIKAPLEKYPSVIGKNIDIEKIKRSINLIINSKIAYEFRSTLVDNLHTYDDVIEMVKTIKGADLFVLQKFESSSILNPKFKTYSSFNDETLNNFKTEALKYVKSCLVR